ncbi:hypothetical protein BJ875DRAFT_388749 [Amylocarpus encephaloides]|uniref:Uncharacterized protein n=1 Tax=Amylocarpus encephaloides TaxID=45428 RepID=A0A9P8C0E2_9HELO|nr:hypothetical protein BJ875DRAFT_388749 [Amylocarpus encephaloides]
MARIIKETEAKSAPIPNNIPEEELLSRYEQFKSTTPSCPIISFEEDGSASGITSFFEDADPKEEPVNEPGENPLNITIQPDDSDAFILYTPEPDTGPDSEIDWKDRPENEEPPVAQVMFDGETEGPVRLRNSRMKSLVKTKDYYLTELFAIDLEVKDIDKAIDENLDGAEDPAIKRRSMISELRTYHLAIKSRQWEYKRQVLDAEFAFALTEEGKKADAVKGVEMKEERRKKDKEKKERRREKRRAEGKVERRGRGGRGGGELKLGSHEVREHGRGGGKKNKMGGTDTFRVNKRDESPRGRGRGRGHRRGGRGGGRGKREGDYWTPSYTSDDAKRSE